MFELKLDVLKISLPEGKTQEEIIALAKEEITEEFEKTLRGLDVKLDGRCTTSLALFLGHKLAHICKSVSILDPKENKFVKSVWH
jgi:hypothetical protein